MEMETTTQARLRGRPYGSTRKEPGKTSTVHVPETTRAWLENVHLPLSWLVAHAPKWYEKMHTQTDDIKDLREGAAKKDALIMRLTTENAELMKFKNTQLQAWRDAARK